MDNSRNPFKSKKVAQSVVEILVRNSNGTFIVYNLYIYNSQKMYQKQIKAFLWDNRC